MNKTLYRAVEKFNQHNFFEAHDILEDHWFECKKSEKNFYQGLLHYTVAFHHLINKKNTQGAILQLKKCIERLKGYDKSYKGINTLNIIKTAKGYLKKLETGEKIRKIPKMPLYKTE